MGRTARQRMAGFGKKDRDRRQRPRRGRCGVLLGKYRLRRSMIAAEGAATGQAAVAAGLRVARRARKAQHVAERVDLWRGGMAGGGEARRKKLDEQKHEREMRRPATRCLAKSLHACDRSMLRTHRT